MKTLSFPTFVGYFQTHKKAFFTGGFIFFVCFLAIFISFFGPNFAGNFKVSGANFDLSVQKIPYNTKSIDITFSQNINAKSLQNNALTFEPKIEGNLSIKDGNTLSFTLKEPLKLGQEYQVFISQQIQNTSGDSLDEDLFYILQATQEARVLKIIPEKDLVNLGKNIGVFFNMPMVALSPLTQNSDIPCPIKIIPEVAGKCQWTSTSIVEFIPTHGFEGATKYEVEIKNTPGMLFELLQPVKQTFSTPKLQATLPDTFLPKDGIEVSFNFPVDIKNLKKYLTLNNAPAKISPVLGSNTHFLVFPENQDFLYSQDFVLNIKAGLPSLYGNIPSDENISKNIKSSDFISYFEVYKNIISQTGSIIDNRYINIGEESYQYRNIPNSDVFFKMYFHEEVPLEKSLFSFVSATGEKIPFEIKYGQTLDENQNSIVDKKSILLTLTSKLLSNTQYSLLLSKKANPALPLEENSIFTAKTSDALKIEKFLFLDASKSCLYVNNRLNCDFGNCRKNKEKFSLSPSGVLKEIGESQYLDWDLEQRIKGMEKETQSKTLIENGYCPLAEKNQSLYVLDTRLSPNSTYSLSISKLEDAYGNSLQNDFQTNFQTKNLKASDTYIYSHLTNYVNVYPKNAPLNVNIQTVNAQSVYVEVCEMTQDAYQKYYANMYSDNNTPECAKRSVKELKTKNVYWKLQNNVINIEKDITLAPLTQNYVLFQVFQDKDLSKKLSFSSHILIKTNLNLFLEKATNKSVFFASDIENGKIIGNLSFEGWDFNGKKQDLGVTFNTKKQAYETKKDLTDIAFISAKNASYEALISNDDYFSNYDFKYISGLDSSVKNYLYTYTDRPIYRPGDEVFIKGLLREFHFDGYKKSPFTSGYLKIYGENNSLYQTLKVTLDANSNFSTHFQIPNESNLGMFEFQFIPENQSNGGNEEVVYGYGNFFIEAYKKPTFKVDVTSPKNDLIEGEKAVFDIAPKYYFGGKMTNTNGKYTLLKQTYFFDGKEFSDFQFGKGSEYFDCVYWGYCNYGDAFVEEKHFEIGESGNTHIEYSFSGAENAEQIYNFQFEITDPDTKKTVTKSVSKVVHATDGYVGLKTPYFNSEKQGVPVEIQTLTHDAKPLPNTSVQINVIKREWKNVKKLGVDGIYYNEYGLEETPISTKNITTNSAGYVSYKLNGLKTGEYEIKALYTGKNGKSFESSSIIYIAGDDFISWRNDNNSLTEFEPLKGSYRVGETASFLLKSPINNGRALILVEKDDGILDYFFHDIKSYGDIVTYKINDKHYPNIYFKVFLIGKQKDNLLPIYKRALSTVKVITDYKKLTVSITPDKPSYRPGEKATITVKVTDQNKQPIANANGSLSVVDESVLALKGNPVKNPYSFFYEMKRYLGVVSWSNLKYLVETLSIKDISGGEKGGAGDQLKGGTPKKERGIFKDTALFVSDFTTDKNGIAKITVDSLPDNLTTWVVEALINTTDAKVGVGYETFFTNNPVMIEDNLPRFFLGNDRITLKPVVYNKTDSDQEFEMQLKINDNLVDKKTLFIKKDERTTPTFFLNIKSSENIEKNETLKVTLSVIATKNKNFSDAISKYIPLSSSYSPEYVATAGKVSGIGFNEKINLSNISNPEITINYSSTLFSNLLNGAKTLEYQDADGAYEKTAFVKSIFIIKNLYKNAGEKYDLKKETKKVFIDEQTGYKDISLDELIRKYLVEIKRYQNIDGGFSHWSEGNYRVSDVELSGFILSTLSKITSLGYDFDTKIGEKINLYLKSQVTTVPTCAYVYSRDCISLSRKLQILENLLDANKDDYEVLKIAKTLENSALQEQEKIQSLLLTQKLLDISSLGEAEKKMLETKKQELTQYILKNHLVLSPKGSFISLNNQSSRLKNTADFLKVLGSFDKETRNQTALIEENMVRFLLEAKNNSSLSQVETLSILEGFGGYLEETFVPENTSFEGKISFNNTKVVEKSFSKKDNFSSWNIKVPKKLYQNKNQINFSLSGSGNLYYDINAKYFVPYSQKSAIDRGFFIKRQYFSYDDFIRVKRLKDEEFAQYLSGSLKYNELKYKKPVITYLTPVQYGKVGDLILVHNSLYTNEPRDHVVFQGFIPSGSELVNTRLDTETQVETLDENLIFDQEELKDDAYVGKIHFLESGIYDISYTIRLTHAGKFHVRPNISSELFHPEVFGNTVGDEFLVQ